SRTNMARFVKSSKNMANPSPLRKTELERPIGISEVPEQRPVRGRWVPLLGRIFFSYLFIIAGFAHFTLQYLSYAIDKGLPLAPLLVPAAGVIAILGGLSILLGFRAKLGAWLIVLFLAPVTLMMHAFWKDVDPLAAAADKVNFMKNISML